MNRNRKGVMPEITREVYKSVKKFDRQQFQSFCKDLYTFGFEDGRQSVPGIDINDIYSSLDGVKGIGPKVMERIREAIDPLFIQEVEHVEQR